MKADHVIYGVHITDRVQQVNVVQNILTEHGCNIRSRIGLHEIDDRFCSPAGLILLEMHGDRTTLAAMRSRLEAIDGVEVQEMVFGH